MGPARNCIRPYILDQGMTCRVLMGHLELTFGDRSPTIELVQRLQNSRRYYGEQLINFTLRLRQAANKIYRRDATMVPIVKHIIWGNLLNECPEDLRAELMTKFDHYRINSAIDFIHEWTGKFPMRSPFSYENQNWERKQKRKVPLQYNIYWTNRNNNSYNQNSPKTYTNKAIGYYNDKEEEGSEQEEQIYLCMSCKDDSHETKDCNINSKQTIQRYRGKNNEDKSKNNKEKFKRYRKDKGNYGKGTKDKKRFDKNNKNSGNK